MGVTRYFRFLLPEFKTSRTGDILNNYNPAMPVIRADAPHTRICIADYDTRRLEECCVNGAEEAFGYRDTATNKWINMDGMRKKDIESLCAHYGIHNLILEDILSVGQRPKMDEIDDKLYFLLNMLYFNDHEGCVETEQISIVLGRNIVISFQEDDRRDVFNPLREKLKLASSKVRQNNADFLCYTMIDLIVDNYYLVLEKLGDRIEALEEEIIRTSNQSTLARVNAFRKELIVLKRNITPVRDLIMNIGRSETRLIDNRTAKYFKDVYDHIVQAHDLTENYRDMMMNLQDLYMNQVNLRANEVMKVIAIVTCLLAPATVIGGIFGMNFDAKVNFFHNPMGFYAAVALMLIIPLAMIILFKKRGWF
jgi:magnesium transporter